MTRTANQAARVITKIYEKHTGRELDFLVVCKIASVVQTAMNGDLKELEDYLSANI